MALLFLLVCLRSCSFLLPGPATQTMSGGRTGSFTVDTLLTFPAVLNTPVTCFCFQSEVDMHPNLQKEHFGISFCIIMVCFILYLDKHEPI